MGGGVAMGKAGLSRAGSRVPVGGGDCDRAGLPSITSRGWIITATGSMMFFCGPSCGRVTTGTGSSTCGWTPGDGGGLVVVGSWAVLCASWGRATVAAGFGGLCCRGRRVLRPWVEGRLLVLPLSREGAGDLGLRLGDRLGECLGEWRLWLSASTWSSSDGRRRGSGSQGRPRCTLVIWWLKSLNL